MRKILESEKISNFKSDFSKLSGSNIARKYFKWLEKKWGEERGEPVEIQSWDSPQGEKKIGNYSVDGFLARPGNPSGDLIIEINGCYW